MQLLDRILVYLPPSSSQAARSCIWRSGFEGKGEIFWFESFQTQDKIGRFAKLTYPAFKLDMPHLGNPSSGRVRLEQQGAVLSLEGFTPADSGRYTVTVTDQSGAMATAECMVTEYGRMNLDSHRRFSKLSVFGPNNLSESGLPCMTSV